MKTELIESLDFTEEDYNEKIAGEDVASFNEFIDAIIVFVEQNGGTLKMQSLWLTILITNYNIL